MVPKAVVADQLGPIENYSLCEVDPGEPASGEVRVRIKAAGVSFVDILNATGKYQGRAPVPFIPGSECAGVIEKTGAGVTGLHVGDCVVATSWGGIFAEAANLPAKNLHLMPAGMGFTEGSVFAVSATTSWHALVDRGQLESSETVLVLGAGGATGYAAVQIAKYLGARVIASASSEEKRALAIEAGADAVVDARSATWREQVKTANNGRPVDVVFDPVGGAATEPAFRSLAYNGRHLIVGFPGGITSLATNLPLLKSASLVGVNLQQFSRHYPEGAAANVDRVLSLGGQGHFKPAIARVYPLNDFAQAMKAAELGTHAGRVVIEM